MTATWTKIGHAQSLQRSSHCITVVGANLYVGEKALWVIQGLVRPDVTDT